MVLAATGSGATGSAATGSAAKNSRPIGPITPRKVLNFLKRSQGKMENPRYDAKILNRAFVTPNVDENS